MVCIKKTTAASVEVQWLSKSSLTIFELLDTSQKTRYRLDCFHSLIFEEFINVCIRLIV